MWEKIVEEHGYERAFQVRAEDDDFSFIRNYLTEDLAHELDLFCFETGNDGKVRVTDFDIDKLHDTLLAPKYNFGAASVFASHVGVDGSLDLVHDHETDGKGLDIQRAERVLEYVHRVWRRPIRLHTVDANGSEKLLTQE